MSKNKNEKKGWWSRHAWIVAILLTLIVIITLVCLKCCNPVDNPSDGNNDDTPTPHNHVWGEYVETTPGDCYVDSIWTATCTCGATTTMTKPATHHQPTTWTREDETWHASYCQCGEYKFESPCEFVAAEVFLPDCEDEGYTIFCCTECENMYMGDIVPAKGHVWLEWVDYTDGQHKRNCENCSAIQTEDCFGGTADCENGARCAICDQEYTDPMGHDWSDWVDNGDGEHKRVSGNDADHVEYERHFDNGEKPGYCGACDAFICAHYVDYYVWTYDSEGHWAYCAHCGTILEEKESHDRIPNEVYPSDCENNGLMLYTCDHCRWEKTEPTPVADHAWGEWVSNGDGTHTRTCLTYSNHTETKECDCTSEVVAQTCLENGYTKHTCADCGYTYNDTVTSMYGHDWSDWCSNHDGTHWRVCGNDETEIETETCTDFQITVIVPISCNGPEEAEYRCKDCGYTYMVEGKDILQHVWEDWKYCDEQYHSSTCLSNTDHVYFEEHVYEEVSRDTHCEEDGTITYACVCGDSYDVNVEATGHDWGPWVTQEDRTSVRTCGNDPTHTETMKVLAGNSVFVTTSTDMVFTVYRDVYEAYPGMYLEVSKPVYDKNGNEVSREVEIITEVYKMEDTKVRFLYRNVMAKEMSVGIDVKVFSGEGECLAEYQYSVRTYAENMLRKDQPMELKTLLVDMLNYGAAAQKYFNYLTDDLANKNLTEEELSWGTQEMPEMTDDEVLTKSEDENSIKLHGNAVSLENSVKLNIHFELGKHNLEDVNIVYTYLNEGGDERRIVVDATEATAIPEGYYRYTFDNAGYAGMRTMVKISFEDKETGEQIGDSVVCSVESYVAQKYAESTDETLQEVLVMILKYGDSANAYAKYIGA